MTKILYALMLLIATLSTPRPLWEGQGGGSSPHKGKATYYSKRATGARTASGIRLHHDSLVCAHRTYPFGTKLLVKNPANGKEVVVKVIDRGPYMKGGIIDLSYEAARRIGIISKGVAMVEVHVYKDKHDVPYRPEPEEIPELDIEITDNFNGSTPAWQNKESAENAVKSKAEEKSAENVNDKVHGQQKETVKEKTKISKQQSANK